ncbi:MAG: alpha/beta fold hydrolase [Deltaproteobacteria bacterium]|nr:alpha/beta fold hydrolase [Deltaproteobacteria bacterium]
MTKAKKGCLIIHGLTGTPANLLPITDALKAKGYLVKAPLLAGHGVDLKTLSVTTWQDWYGSLVRAHDELSREVDQIFFVGLSMGALLGLKLAEDGANNIKAMALLGLPLKLWPLFDCLIIPLVRYTPLRFSIRSTPKNFEKSVLDPKGREIYRQNSLCRMPAPAAFQIQDLAKIVERDLNKMNQPLLLLHGHHDHLVDPKGMLTLKKKVASKQVEIVMLEHSGHVLPLDYDRDIVVQKIINFFDSHANDSQTL